MTDPLKRWLEDRVDAATPSTLAPFQEIAHRARRDRLRRTVAVLTGAAVAASIVVGGWSLRDPVAGPGPRPADPATSQSSGDPAPARPEPTYDRSERYASGLVVRLPDRDVDLPANDSCWTGPRRCLRALLPGGDTGPDLGEQDAIEFWFARPGWTFSGTFLAAGASCPRNTTVEAVRTGDQWFRLPPADEAGTYVVDLHGQGPEGAVSSRFLWTTTADGPVDPPVGTVALFPGSRGEGSYALELMVNDLPFHPVTGEVPNMVEVDVTSADGRTRTLTAPLERSTLDCGDRGVRGFFYYQAEWADDIATLGRRPLQLEVELTIRGTTHAGRATWRDARGRFPYSELVFQPPLPTEED